MVKKRILITGNLGYIGPVVTNYFRRHEICDDIVGIDRGFFEQCIAVPPTEMLSYAADTQFYCDVRALEPSMFDGVDAVVHLAALSNDPIGKEYENITQAINAAGTLNVARMAKANGVRHFVFASSCSVYGSSGNARRTEGAGLDPLTAYARSKVEAEEGLKEIADKDFVVTCHRFATACGMSPRLRLDLVLNDFVACAIASGRIQIMSDGSPWRPLIDVEDMARAIAWSVGRNAKSGGVYCVLNTGSDEWNYQVKDLAYAAQRFLPNIDIDINESAEPDKRSYRVDFTLFRTLAPTHQPTVSLDESIRRLYGGLSRISLSDSGFRESYLIRLMVLKRLRGDKRVDCELWPMKARALKAA